MSQILLAATMSAACGAACTFGDLDPVVQGSIVAAAAALVGTLATLFVTGGTTAWQAWIQRQERNRDRALEIKKDALLDALRGVRDARFVLTRFMDIDTPIVKILNEFNAAAKLAGSAAPVASIPTVEAMREMALSTGAVFRDLMARRRAVDDAVNARVKSEAMLEKLEAMRPQLAAKRRSLEQGPNAILGELRELNEMERQLQLGIQRSEESLQAARDNLNTILPPFVDYCVRAQMSLQSTEQKLVQAARIDIGVDADKSNNYIKASHVDIERLFAQEDRQGE